MLCEGGPMFQTVLEQDHIRGNKLSSPLGQAPSVLRSRPNGCTKLEWIICCVGSARDLLVS